MLNTSKLIVIAYAANSSQGPEGFVNTSFLKALYAHWVGEVSVITAGKIDFLDFQNKSKWKIYSIFPEQFSDSQCSAIDRIFQWAIQSMHQNSKDIIFAKIFNRIIYYFTGYGAKLTYWRLRCERQLKKELENHSGNVIVHCRILPFIGLMSAKKAKRKFRFIWSVNINDPIPSDIWRGVHRESKFTNDKIRSFFRKQANQIDLFTFPSANLRDIEYKSFLNIKKIPHIIIPHTLPGSVERKLKKSIKNKKLEIAFSGSLRKNRMRDEFKNALLSIQNQDPSILDSIKIKFYFNLSYEKLIKDYLSSLPVENEVISLGRESNKFEDIAQSDVLLNLESEQDGPLLLTKVVNYISLRKPIWAICAQNGTTWSLLSKYNCGYLAACDNELSIVKSVYKISNDWKKDKLSQRASSEVLVNYFSAEKCIDKFTQIHQKSINNY